MSVVQVFLGRPRDLLPSIFPSISCSCVELCLIRCRRYCNFLVLNCLTISLYVPILLNTSSLVIFSVHDIFSRAYSSIYPHLKGIKSGQQRFFHRFSHAKVGDDDEEEKRECNPPHACLNVEHFGISSACFHTAAGVKVGLECLEGWWICMGSRKVSIFSRVTHGGCSQKFSSSSNGWRWRYWTNVKLFIVILVFKVRRDNHRNDNTGSE